jgi:hypothetical protein
MQTWLSQETLAQAKRWQEQAKQLAGDCATVLESLCTFDSISADKAWLVLRPVLRVLLWLVPEHVPLHTSLLEDPAAAARLSSQRSTKAEKRGGQAKAGTVAPADWKASFPTSFVQDVATVGGQGQVQHQYLLWQAKCLLLQARMR